MAPAIHRAVAVRVPLAAPNLSKVPTVSMIWRILTRRGFVVPQPPQTPPLVAETLVRQTAQPVLARRCHPTGAWPITLRWILDVIDDHPGWPSAAALRTIFAITARKPTGS
jgi:hypothetical protein